MAKLTSAPVRASGTLTASGVFSDGQTVVVGGKTYTVQATLTDVDGNVQMGAAGAAAATLQNLYYAINLTGTAGTHYAASMTKNAQVEATAVTATTLVVKAGAAGTVGNLIASTETCANAAWGGATLSGGTGDTAKALREIIAYDQLNAAVLDSLNQMGYSV